MEISFFLKNSKISRQKCEGKIGVIDGFLRGWRAYKKGKIKEIMHIYAKRGIKRDANTDGSFF